MDSLGLLQPTSSSPTTGVSKPPAAAYVEYLCTRVIECISSRRWDDQIFEHFTPDFQAFVSTQTSHSFEARKSTLIYINAKQKTIPTIVAKCSMSVRT